MQTLILDGDARSAMEQMIEPWSRACMERDWDTLLAMCNDDIIFMPPGAPAVTGAAVRPWLDSFPEILAMSWSIDMLEQVGDLAWLRGPVNQTLVIDGQHLEFKGKYTDVIRRGRDGLWRYSLIVWNSNAP